MNNYISCLDEKNYSDYFQCIRNYVNSKNSFKEASYFIRTNSGTEAIPKNLIFYKIYGNINLPENSHLVVSLKKKDDIIEYIKNIGKRREDIYFNSDLRTKIPESILLRNSKNAEDIKKLIEARPYGFTTIEDIKKLKMSLDKRLVDNFYAPLSLSFPILLNNQKYFPNIRYISKPYTIDTPYVFRILLGSYDIIKVPIELFNYNLSVLSIMDIVEASTIEPFLLGLPYDFELDRKNLNKFEIQIKFDEFKYRFYYSTIKTLELFSNLKFSPVDIKTYQITMNNDGNVKPIDFASGFDVPISQKGLEKIIVEDLNDIIEGILESPLIKHCTKNENYVICNEKIKESELPEILVEDIERSLLENYYYNRTDNLDNLIKNIKIGDRRLDDIIIQHKEDEFEENKEIVSKALELYLRSYNS
ncbi:MAG: hypothetical protein RXQ68_01500 [Candidatus Nanopusillus sp.]